MGAGAGFPWARPQGSDKGKRRLTVSEGVQAGGGGGAQRPGKM